MSRWLRKATTEDWDDSEWDYEADVLEPDNPVHSKMLDKIEKRGTQQRDLIHKVRSEALTAFKQNIPVDDVIRNCENIYNDYMKTQSKCWVSLRDFFEVIYLTLDDFNTIDSEVSKMSNDELIKFEQFIRSVNNKAAQKTSELIRKERGEL